MRLLCRMLTAQFRPLKLQHFPADFRFCFRTYASISDEKIALDPAALNTSAILNGLDRQDVGRFLDRIRTGIRPDEPETSGRSGSAAEWQRLAYEWHEQMTARRELGEMLETEKDWELCEMARIDLERVVEELESLERQLAQLILAESEQDSPDEVILEVYAGAGGAEASLFAAEIIHMYGNYAAFRGWPAMVVDNEPSDVGGLRSASLSLKGAGAFGWLQHEGGVHRVQRVPATERGGRLHTSTASVAVLPVPTEASVGVSKKDIEFTHCKASGPGGMNVNANATAARVKHLPTGIAVECQVHRYLLQNQEACMKKLLAILYERQQSELSESVKQDRSKQVGRGDRNEKIRTYNFPNLRVSDHRLRQQWHQLKDIMQGGQQLHAILECLQDYYNAQRVQQIITDVLLEK